MRTPADYWWQPPIPKEHLDVAGRYLRASSVDGLRFRTGHISAELGVDIEFALVPQRSWWLRRRPFIMWLQNRIGLQNDGISRNQKFAVKMSDRFPPIHMTKMEFDRFLWGIEYGQARCEDKAAPPTDKTAAKSP